MSRLIYGLYAFKNNYKLQFSVLTDINWLLHIYCEHTKRLFLHTGDSEIKHGIIQSSHLKKKCLHEHFLIISSYLSFLEIVDYSKPVTLT